MFNACLLSSIASGTEHYRLQRDLRLSDPNSENTALES